jgi:hypothetical protein
MMMALLILEKVGRTRRDARARHPIDQCAADGVHEPHATHLAMLEGLAGVTFADHLRQGCANDTCGMNLAIASDFAMTANHFLATELASSLPGVSVLDGVRSGAA